MISEPKQLFLFCIRCGDPPQEGKMLCQHCVQQITRMKIEAAGVNFSLKKGGTGISEGELK